LHELIGYKKTMLQVIEGLTYPYSITGKYGGKFTNEVARTMRTMSRGALTEFKDTLKGIANKKLPATALYDAVITTKTGVLFELATRFGAMSATCNLDIIDRFARYGLHVGKAMQIADDIHDQDRLLFKCLTVDSLVKEFFMDVKTHSVKVNKVKEIWSSEQAKKVLQSMLEREYALARDSLVDGDGVVEWLNEEYAPLFYVVPEEIARIMLSE
jgi:geranylgeranyl pyrophosphate synthase